MKSDFYTKGTPEFVRTNEHVFFSEGRAATKPSPQLSTQLKSNGHDQLNIVGWSPVCCDRYQTQCVFMIEDHIKDKKIEYFDLKINKKLPYQVVKCTSCGAFLAYFQSEKSSLDPSNLWINLHYLCYANQHGWYGCREVNINKEDRSVTFECGCFGRSFAISKWQHGN